MISGQTTEKPITVAEWERLLREAKSIEDVFSAVAVCPIPDPDVNIMKAINESRRLTGFRLPDPTVDERDSM